MGVGLVAGAGPGVGVMRLGSSEWAASMRERAFWRSGAIFFFVFTSDCVGVQGTGVDGWGLFSHSSRVRVVLGSGRRHWSDV